jgi:hypothetical protein
VAEGGGRTINGALELLVADLAGELADAGFLVELHGDGFLVVAEEAGERCGQRFVLQQFVRCRAIKTREGVLDVLSLGPEASWRPSFVSPTLRKSDLWQQLNLEEVEGFSP